MNKFFRILFSILLIAPAVTYSQNTFKWLVLEDGLLYTEADAPEKSFLNDSKISILKIDPTKFEFLLLCASEHDKQNRTASEWAEEFKMEVTVNAGMFFLTDFTTNRGYMKNYGHLNNSKFNTSYNAMIAFNPVDSTKNPFDIIDLKCAGWDSFNGNYNTYSQNMRMIDCNGNGLSWNKNAAQQCSMVFAAIDSVGSLYFIFCRSPYSHNKMIEFILALVPGVRTTAYLEGGPEASLYINNGETKIEKIGSYVTKTFENDDNDHFWKIPNVIGIRKKIN